MNLNQLLAKIEDLRKLGLDINKTEVFVQSNGMILSAKEFSLEDEVETFEGELVKAVIISSEPKGE